MLEKSDIVEKYIKIAFSDIGSYIEKAENGEVIFRNLKETDTTLIKEIKNTKYGVSIKLEDRSGALKWLAEHYDLMTEEQKARVNLMNKQAGNETADHEDTGVIMLQEVAESE